MNAYIYDCMHNVYISGISAKKTISYVTTYSNHSISFRIIKFNFIVLCLTWKNRCNYRKVSGYQYTYIHDMCTFNSETVKSDVAFSISLMISLFILGKHSEISAQGRLLLVSGFLFVLAQYSASSWVSRKTCLFISIVGEFFFHQNAVAVGAAVAAVFQKKKHAGEHLFARSRRLL